MAGAEHSDKAVFRLKLLVDKKKNKVVLAEAGKEFVDVLFSFLTLPIGTIVRLLEKYEKNEVSEATKIGCFNNLYKSVLDIDTHNFMTKACKDMLLYPRSVMEYQRKRLKLNVDDTETLKYYTCSRKECPHNCISIYYSNFSSTECLCGALMTREVKVEGSVGGGEIFFSHKPLFTLTDNLKVGFTCTSHTLKTLKVSGYSDVDQLHEMYVDVDHGKVVALLQYLFSSDTPLTDLFLTKNRFRVIPNLVVHEESGGVTQSKKVMSVSVFTRKLDNKIIYIESEKDFVDLLLTYLVLPLNSAWKLAGSRLLLGCIDNLCESFNSLSSLNNKCMLPSYYSCQQTLLDVCYEEYRDEVGFINSKYITLRPRDRTDGFVKSGSTFMVCDDLTIAPMDLSATICSLKKWNMGLDDVEERVINISEAEAIKLLRASFVTTNALNTVFQSLLLKKPKEEKV